MIQTSRLRLRPLERADLAHMQRYAVRPEFYRYLPIPVQTAETVAAFLESQLMQAAGPDAQHWVFAVEPFEVGHLVGTVRMTVLSKDHRTADLGYGQDSDFCGRGYMTEAARAMLGFGFRGHGLHRIWATADVENVASWRLLERIGMKREGLLRQDKLVRGQWRDSYVYAIMEDEFR